MLRAAASRVVKFPGIQLINQGLKATSVRTYHENASLYGYRAPRRLQVEDYTAEQIHNRNENANLVRLVKAFRTYGHLDAELDPLGIQSRRRVAELDPNHYGIASNDRKYKLDGILYILDENGKPQKEADINTILTHLRKIYCSKLGFEFNHIPDTNERRWFSRFIEGLSNFKVDKEQKLRIFQLLNRSETFDNFMAKRFPQVKRYGLEGAESMMVALDSLFKSASDDGVEEIVLGMPHRGRLNLLTDLLQFSPTRLFHKIKGYPEFPDSIPAEGDVISHLTSSVKLQYAQKDVHVTVLHNPSHLEAVNPVAVGKARGKQMYLYETKKKGNSLGDCQIGDRVLCIQMHGDAAFTGQGVVMETLGLSGLPHFASGGSIHVIVNNQIGFTTPAVNSSSGIYTSDVGKMINAPVIHVNGDYPENVVAASHIATTYRNKFRKDIIIDLITYRRWGHNELDEPAFTQPQMYSNIRTRKSVPLLYTEKLAAEKVIDGYDQVDKLKVDYFATLDKHMAACDTYVPEADHLKGKWSHLKPGLFLPGTRSVDFNTSFDTNKLKEIGNGSVKAPNGFVVHPRLIKSHVQDREKQMETGKKIDWATAEALAFGSLLTEGHNVRISGQDVGRGTFSHRHLMLVDQNTEEVVIPLNQMSENQGHIEVANSSLSEIAVLGFEYGLSWENPDDLFIWEAQFGDFFNGAQVVIDAFVSSGETKWLRQSGLTMLLPHGYDGAGPEHSSCRIERFLQGSDEPFSQVTDATHNPNWHVVNPTTPAQYFHLLRRQLKRDYRKPLILVAPKILLRLSSCVSTLEEMGPGSKFMPVLGDRNVAPEKVNQVVYCSGKLYYDLVKQRESAKRNDVAIVRVEELTPFPFNELREESKKYVNAKNFVWCQEEPQNMGAWFFIEPRFESILPKDKRIELIARRPTASPATGVPNRHKVEQANIIKAITDSNRANRITLF